MVFLFSLGILNRFLGALKSQLERQWSEQHKTAHSRDNEKPTKQNIRGHTRQRSRALRPQPVRLEEPEGQETEPLSPAPQLYHAEEGGIKQQLERPSRLWVSSAPWSLKRDALSAVLEFVRALIGYIL